MKNVVLFGRKFPLTLLCLRVSVCLSVCRRAYLSNRTSELHQVFYACFPWPWLRSPLAALWYVKNFRFCGWRHFSSNLQYACWMSCTFKVCDARLHLRWLDECMTRLLPIILVVLVEKSVRCVCVRSDTDFWNK